MIISNAAKVRTSDPSTFAWAKLRKFQNIELVADTVQRLHRVENKYRDNVRKQARQLRYCMIQAREYFTAAETVSVATKPNLLYYGTMSLALAEILFKQSGESSLDKARDEHRHHGLSMTAGGIPRGANLTTAAAQLRAIPHIVSGSRKGTFEIWHRASREHPLCGYVYNNFGGGGSTNQYGIIMGAIDEPYPSIPSGGITLGDCLAGLPLLMEQNEAVGLLTPFVRGKCESHIWSGDQWRQQIRLTLHPSSLVSRFIESIPVQANIVDRINLFEVGSGLHIDMQNDWVNGSMSLPLPPAATVNTEEWRIWTNKPTLNEFGYFYVALFLAGNYARYYPDRWLQDVEQSTPLALAIEELCTLAESRVPWLSLCELDMNIFANEA
jgi:hypothetical protein